MVFTYEINVICLCFCIINLHSISFKLILPYFSVTISNESTELFSYISGLYPEALSLVHIYVFIYTTCGCGCFYNKGKHHYFQEMQKKQVNISLTKYGLLNVFIRKLLLFFSDMFYFCLVVINSLRVFKNIFVIILQSVTATISLYLM